MIMLNDLLRHNQLIMSELNKAVTEVLSSGWYVLGSQVKEFEREFSLYCQTEYCISVANGTEALELALRALDISAGGKVITVANAGAYSTTAILNLGATPVFVDIDPNTMLLSVEHLRLLVNSEIKAIIVTHLFGQSGPMADVLKIAAEFGIPVVEDCAQAHGALINNRRVGSIGVLGCFSFYPTKNLGALGDGGAITTSDSKLAERLKKLRQYGWQGKYEIELPGGRNSRLDEIQAAILRTKLPFLDKWNYRRFEISQRYVARIRHELVTVPNISSGSYVGHLFVIRTEQRTSLREHLKRCGILNEVHYPIPDYRQPAFAKLFPGLLLTETERACVAILTLPCFPEMSNEEVNHVIESVNTWSVS